MSDSVSAILLGHVDAGKSTLAGALLVETGAVNERDVEKCKQDAKANKMDSWYLAYLMDLSETERLTGKTTQVGVATIKTSKREYNLLDAPGHRHYVKEVASAAYRAQIGILIVSARKGEYESGFEKDGQTREHLVLARSLGVERLIIAITKCDLYTKDELKSRVLEISKGISPFVKSVGFSKPIYATVSSMEGNVQPLLDALDSLEISDRNQDPLRISVLEKGIGVVTSGSVEKDQILVGVRDSKVVAMESGRSGEIICLPRSVQSDILYDQETKIVESDNVICCLSIFDNAPLVSVGSTMVAHYGDQVVTATVDAMRETFIRAGGRANVGIKFNRPIAVEAYTGSVKTAGRLLMRKGDETIGIARILKVIS